uniref:Glycosyl transferase family 25 domain-containing protein n=1 Tax=Megaselia scalaris TaxID=36166 RepID=T1H0D3_MEGSC
MGIKYLEGYKDPHENTTMTLGEPSQNMGANDKKGETQVLVLEDDIRFEPNFTSNALHILKQIRELPNWDFLYFGRMILSSQKEFTVHGIENIVSVDYSYWTIGYAITLEGAKKLVNAKPLKSLLPVDEYIPIMYDRHPNKTWSNVFPNRNLSAYSASPLLLYPQLYGGEPGFISDTEYSEIINTKDNCIF